MGGAFAASGPEAERGFGGHGQSDPGYLKRVGPQVLARGFKILPGRRFGGGRLRVLPGSLRRGYPNGGVGCGGRG
jgi:hypothetical protein